MEALIDCSRSLRQSCLACLSCFGHLNSVNAYVTVNGERYRIIRLLGENNRSLTFVYLVESTATLRFLLRSPRTSRRFVLKKVLCPIGEIELVAAAMREVDMYRVFSKSPYVIRSEATEVVQRSDGSKLVYMLSPYYPSGSLQDVINQSLLDGSRVTLKYCVSIMLGICEALSYLHGQRTAENHMTGDHTSTYHVPSNGSVSSFGPRPQMEDSLSVSIVYADEAASLLDDTPLELSTFADSYDDHSTYSSTMTVQHTQYAHMNLKPSKILLDDNGRPILNDLSSCLRLPITVRDTHQLDRLQEWLQLRCTPQNMAPELLNLQLNSVIDSKVDIWSLGCTIYTLMYGVSPFDREEQLTGIPLRYAILNAQYNFPDEPKYPKQFMDIVSSCLVADSSKRPTSMDLVRKLRSLDV